MTREPASGYDSRYTATYTVTNTLMGGTVTVSNTVLNGSMVLPFTYRAKATLGNGEPLTGTVDGLTFDSTGEAVFTLKHGEKQELTLPLSVTVDVTQDAMPGYSTTRQETAAEADPVPFKAKSPDTDRAASLSIDFVNDLSFSVCGLKTVDGEEPGSGATFTYQLLDDQGTVLQETTNAADGSFSFSPKIGLTDQSELTFTVCEVDDADLAESYIMDTVPREVTVTLPEEGGVTVSADEEHPVQIDNRRMASFVIHKIWEDDADLNIAGRLTLYADGKKVDEDSYRITVSEGNYTYTFHGLPERDETGRKILYSVKESVPSGYLAVYPDDQNCAYNGDTIRNILSMKLTVKKVWKNVDKQGKQTIKLDLYRNGELYRTYTRKPNKDGIYTFTLPNDPYGEYWFVE